MCTTTINGLKRCNQGCWRISFLKCLYKSDYYDDLISKLWDHVDGPTGLYHWNRNHKLNSYGKGINCNIRSLGKKTKGFLGRFLPIHTHWALLVSLKWTEAAEVSYHSATNVSWLQRRACGVNPPWQDCWDGSASTATLAGSVCLAIHTATKLARRGSANQDAAKVTARARSSFALCRYGCCILFLFSWERSLREWEMWQRDGETSSLRSEAECWSSTCSLAWITVAVGPDAKVPSIERGVY